MKLEPLSLVPPPGLNDFLHDLGKGENGFGGSGVPDGSQSLEAYLTQFSEMTDESKLAAGRAPQSNFWLLAPDGHVVGMLKIRHHLTARTRISGGHIGYYIHGDHRGKGFGKAALALALEELKRWGEPKALITIYPENVASIKVAEANGADYADTVHDPEANQAINRYWIPL